MVCIPMRRSCMLKMVKSVIFIPRALVMGILMSLERRKRSKSIDIAIAFSYSQEPKFCP